MLSGLLLIAGAVLLGQVLGFGGIVPVAVTFGVLAGLVGVETEIAVFETVEQARPEARGRPRRKTSQQPGQTRVAFQTPEGDGASPYPDRPVCGSRSLTLANGSAKISAAVRLRLPLDNLSPIIPRGACDQTPSFRMSTLSAPSWSSSTRSVLPSLVRKNCHTDAAPVDLITASWARCVRRL